MKDVRYVIRLAHSNAFAPSDQAALLSKVRDVVRPLGGEAINLRVSRRALEFDLFCKPESELHTFLTALEPLGAVLSYKRLDLPPITIVPAQVVAEARTLFNEERYWEAHETLEGLWKQTQGQEKQLLQGMILTAAALVHAQKNESTVVEPMLQDAARRLENQPPLYLGLEIETFLNHVKKLIRTKMPYFPTI